MTKQTTTYTAQWLTEYDSGEKTFNNREDAANWIDENMVQHNYDLLYENRQASDTYVMVYVEAGLDEPEEITCTITTEAVEPDMSEDDSTEATTSETGIGALKHSVPGTYEVIAYLDDGVWKWGLLHIEDDGTRTYPFTDRNGDYDYTTRTFTVAQNVTPMSRASAIGGAFVKAKREANAQVQNAEANSIDDSVGSDDSDASSTAALYHAFNRHVYHQGVNEDAMNRRIEALEALVKEQARRIEALEKRIEGHINWRSRHEI